MRDDWANSAPTTPDGGSSASPASPAAQFDVIGILLRCRRVADLSQRDLAALLQVSPSTVARWENGTRMPPADVLAAVVALAGYRLAMVDDQDQPIEPAPSEPLRDRAGRRVPAHLDVHLWHETIWGLTDSGNWGYTTRSVHAPRRVTRDRHRQWLADHGVPVVGAPGHVPYHGVLAHRRCHDIPTLRDFQHWRDCFTSDMRARTRARLLRWPITPPEPCFCTVECHEHPGCPTDCPCQCEPVNG
ncbi:helix-turn-helix domain-containing protein [Aestuariimicrobium sp. Y1814]|uniref:helix-turn-helix domain-containing protein n=1 Tax=Aestuariimicrobium sp. Y1814 TaxID=3418742 RepID=UPI003DA7359F